VVFLGLSIKVTDVEKDNYQIVETIEAL